MADANSQFILVIEADANIQHNFREMLELEGYHAISVSSWPEALDIIRERRPALIVANGIDPESYGMVQQLRSDMATSDIRFLLTCKCPEKLDVEALFGAHDLVLRAYFTPQEFLEAVKSVLE
jgi:CheY-like chemotaxis protein